MTDRKIQKDIWAHGHELQLKGAMPVIPMLSWVILNWLLKQVLETVAAAATKLLQSCPTLCDPIDSSPPGSPVPGILQARTQEWVAISFTGDSYCPILNPKLQRTSNA